MRSPSPPKLPPIASTPPSAPALRADAARNRERIVAAAIEVFAERGLEASTAEIAQRAGLGEATLFRRFAHKDELITAIVETQMDEVISVAAECLKDPDPWQGLERFFSEMVERRASDQGVLDAAKDRCMIKPELEAQRRRIMELMSALVRRAQEAGVVRDDLTGPDLAFLLTAAGAAIEMPFPGLRPDIWRRYLGVILDGIRPEGATRLRPGPPSRRTFERPEL
jgi:AcrR family transcriptional regulator